MKENSLPKIPKAYVEGFCDFYGRDFVVSPDVLIPRPETEAAVDAVLTLMGKAILPGVKALERVLNSTPRIIDVGTGSGCIGLTVAMELPEAKVTISDVSTKALKIARENAEKFNVKNVEILKSNLLDEISGKFDVIVANLPYVDRNWDFLDLESLSFEPELALFAEEGGLSVIFELIRQAEGRTKYLILEADPMQHLKIIQFAKEKGFSHKRTRGYILEFSS